MDYTFLTYLQTVPAPTRKAMESGDLDPGDLVPSLRRIPLGVFPPPVIVPPMSEPHQITLIILHGRGSNSRKFHAPLLSHPAPNLLSLQQALPHARFVFPEAAMMRAAKYRRMLIHQWYEGTGDWEPEIRCQMTPAIEHIHELLREEIRLLHGKADRVVLAGFSQGCAMAMMSLLLWEGETLGAMVGMCGFMPLHEALAAILEENAPSDSSSNCSLSEEDDDDDDVFERDTVDMRSPLQKAIDELREEAELPPSQPRTTPFPFLSTAVFIGHGMEDQNVELRHGESMARLLAKMGLDVMFQRYKGLGHWYSSDMLGDIVEFLRDKFDL